MPSAVNFNLEETGYRRGVQALIGEGSLKRLPERCCSNWVDESTGRYIKFQITALIDARIDKAEGSNSHPPGA